MEWQDYQSIDIETDRPFWVAFNCFQGIGPKRFGKILQFFGNAEAAWQAKKSTWQEINLPTGLLKRFFEFQQQFQPQKFYQEITKMSGSTKGEWVLVDKRRKNWQWVKKRQGYQLVKSGPIAVITWLDDNYPIRLKEIATPPPVLYCRGESFGANDQSVFDLPALAVVGTRRVTSYGKAAVAKIVPELARAGLVIVSGMARGVDGQAHRATLKSSGKTVAVLGTGVDVVYPKNHRQLYQEIVESGLVISEFPPGFPPLPGNFPARNRIISGLVKAVLVVEGNIKSGSLITARCAADQGRDVMAVPGGITAPMSAGPLYLLKNGAKPITSAKDVLEEFPGLEEVSKRATQLSSQEQELVNLLKTGNLTVDDICQKLEWNVARVTGCLTQLEIKAQVKNLGGARWGLI